MNRFNNVSTYMGLIVCAAVLASCAVPAAPAAPTQSPPTVAAADTSTPLPPTPSPEPTLVPPPYTGLGLEKLTSYTAIAEFRFAGKTAWSYALEVRRDKNLQEYRLHIEGIDPQQNPGDVRLVTDGITSRVIGAGTDNECFQFPTKSDLQPAFFMPDKLIATEILNPALTPSMAGKDDDPAIAHLQASPLAMGDWGGVTLDIWLSRANGVVLRYDFSAAGIDPIFKTGEGMMLAAYSLKEGKPASIEPVPGCEIEWPLPEGVSGLVRLPGVVSFDTTMEPVKTLAFYKTSLAAAGWKSVGNPVVNKGISAASYLKGNEIVDITIEGLPAGSRVKFMKSAQ